jgi:hypothetical protein
MTDGIKADGFFVIDSITRKEERHYYALIRIKWHGNKGRSHVWGYHLTAEDEIQAYIQTVEFMHGKRKRGDGVCFKKYKLVQHEWRKTKPNKC